MAAQTSELVWSTDMYTYNTTTTLIDNHTRSYQDCAYPYSDISLLKDQNITSDVKLAWPCELREYWLSVSPFVTVVECLLNYGTIIIIFLGLVFNLLTISTLSMKSMRNGTTNMYLLALAVYDSCVLLFNFMVGVLRGQHPDTVNRTFQENEWLCIVHSVVVELFNLLSVWMIVCFTVERFIAVSFPLKVSRYCSVAQTRLTIVLMTLAICIISLHKVFVSGFEGDSVFGYKACLTNRKKFPEVIYVYVAFNTWLPAVVIIVMNSLIKRLVHRSTLVQKRMSLKDHKKKAKGVRRENQITRTLLATSITYVLLLLPLGIIQTTELWIKSHSVLPSDIPLQQIDYIKYQKTCILLKWIRALCFFFYQFNFGINFFIYTITNRNFRRVLVNKFPGLFPDWFYKRYCASSSAPTSLNKSLTSLRSVSNNGFLTSRSSVKSTSTIEIVDDNKSTSQENIVGYTAQKQYPKYIR